MIIPFYHQKKSTERYNVVRNKFACVELTFYIFFKPLDPDSSNPDPEGP